MIGDVLVSSIFFEILKKEYPESELHYIINTHTSPVIENNPFIDKIIFFKPSFRKNRVEFIKFLWLIKKEKYDIVIDAYSKLESNLITLFSRAKTKISYHKYYTKFIYTNSIKPTKNPKTNLGLAIENRLQLLQPLDIKIDYSVAPKLYLNKDDETSVRQVLPQHRIDLSKKTIMISIIGSSDNKTYPLNYMAEIVDYIAENLDCNLLFNYIPSQIEDAKKVYNLCKSNTKQKVYFDIIAKDLKSFISLINQCDFIIGNDGGAINIAKALHKPSFIIFSPWIKKKAWATFEDGIYHKSVHLKDYCPNLFNNLNKSQLKNSSINLYQKFKPHYFKDQLIDFIKQLNQKKINQYNITDSIRKMPVKPLTALIITYNEEQNINALIENLSFANQIIIVDSFSNDNTIAKIKEYKHVKLIQNEFKNFSNQRNFALQHVTTDWVLFIDADERVTPKLKNEILSTINDSDSDIVAYQMYRQFYYKNQKLSYSGWQTDKVFRLYKKDFITYKKDLFVHELIDVNGKKGVFKNKLIHYSYSSYSNYKHKMSEYAKLRATELALKNLKPNAFHFYIKPIYRFFNHYILRLGFLDGKKGIIICYLSAYYVYKRYVELTKLYNK